MRDVQYCNKNVLGTCKWHSQSCMSYYRYISECVPFSLTQFDLRPLLTGVKEDNHQQAARLSECIVLISPESWQIMSGGAGHRIADCSVSSSWRALPEVELDLTQWCQAFDSPLSAVLMTCHLVVQQSPGEEWSVVASSLPAVRIDIV